jgi:hypothetical protein
MYNTNNNVNINVYVTCVVLRVVDGAGAVVGRSVPRWVGVEQLVCG